MREHGVSLTEIAGDLGKDLSMVSRVNRGQRRSHEIEQEISRRLGLSPQDAFPEWHRRRYFISKTVHFGARPDATRWMLSKPLRKRAAQFSHVGPAECGVKVTLGSENNG